MAHTSEVVPRHKHCGTLRDVLTNGDGEHQRAFDASEKIVSNGFKVSFVAYLMNIKLTFNLVKSGPGGR